MSIRQTQKKIEQMTDQIKATKRANDFRLLKLAMVMIILAIIAAFMYGRIQLW